MVTGNFGTSSETEAKYERLPKYGAVISHMQRAAAGRGTFDLVLPGVLRPARMFLSIEPISLPNSVPFITSLQKEAAFPCETHS